jgi:hypothetical protein
VDGVYLWRQLIHRKLAQLLRALAPNSTPRMSSPGDSDRNILADVASLIRSEHDASVYCRLQPAWRTRVCSTFERENVRALLEAGARVKWWCPATHVLCRRVWISDQSPSKSGSIIAYVRISECLQVTCRHVCPTYSGILSGWSTFMMLAAADSYNNTPACQRQ